MHIFISYFVFRMQSAKSFFSKKFRQMKAGQNNKYKDLKSFSGLILPQIIFFGKFLSTFLAIISSERMNLLDVMLQIELCTKTFAAVLAHVRSNIELTTCFHEFFKYESTNFLTNLGFLLLKKGIFSQFWAFEKIKTNITCATLVQGPRITKVLCYSHFGNWVRNADVSIT